jgi:hypothetical protein
MITNHTQALRVMDQLRPLAPGTITCLHGSPLVFRLSLAAAAHVLFGGKTVALVDGTNRFDLYALAEFARRQAASGGNARHMTPGELLDRIYVSRAFTCYQMEAAVTERLPAFLRKSGAPVAVIYGLLDTFYDEQAPLFEVRAGLRRIIAALHRLRNDKVTVLLASQDMRLASPERNGLLPALMKEMDRVYYLEDDRPAQGSKRGHFANQRGEIAEQKR